MTYGFDAPVLVYLDDDGASVHMAEERVYTARKGDSWRLPKGFRTDFATIPAIVSWAVAKLGAYTLAAIVHDLLCKGLNAWYRASRAALTPQSAYSHAEDGVLCRGRVITPPTANAVDTDAIFYRIARDHGVDRVTASLLWTGVRWGALANPARREGWLRTAPAVLGLSLLFAPVLIPATVFAVAGRAVLRVARWVTR